MLTGDYRLHHASVKTPYRDSLITSSIAPVLLQRSSCRYRGFTNRCTLPSFRPCSTFQRTTTLYIRPACPDAQTMRAPARTAQMTKNHQNASLTRTPARWSTQIRNSHVPASCLKNLIGRWNHNPGRGTTGTAIFADLSASALACKTEFVDCCSTSALTPEQLVGEYQTSSQPSQLALDLPLLRDSKLSHCT
jgi:hypothetical protein